MTIPSSLPGGYDMPPFSRFISSPIPGGLSYPAPRQSSILKPGREAGNRASPGGRTILPTRSSRLASHPPCAEGALGRAQSARPVIPPDPVSFALGRFCGYLALALAIPINSGRYLIRGYLSLFRQIRRQGFRYNVNQGKQEGTK